MEAQALRQILDHIPSSVAVYTPEGRLVYCNHTYLQRFGAGEAPEGRPFLVPESFTARRPHWH